MDKKIVIIMLLIIVISVESLLLVQTYEYYDQTNTQYQALSTQYQTLLNEKTSLQNSYNALDTLHHDLSQEKQELETDYNALVYDYNLLSVDYAVETCLRIGNSLESYYDYLRQELGPTGTEYWWQSPDPNYWQTSVDFAVNLALHDLRRTYWPSIEADYYDAIGEYSYDTAFVKIHEVLDLIDINISDSITDKIRKILSFIDRYIQYELEVNDVFLAPVETLGYKSGDCDDFSILVAALFDEVGIESAVGFFVNAYDQYHAMVLVNVNDLGEYGYYYYEDLTQSGLESGQWIILEPQTTIENQATSWIEQWDLFAASELDV
ncbi:MAG: hypothetical protein JSV20_07600 [Candidatus Bathyarchaeota archaeon]|nr:MAG: hypothetical protein JSV20_07600 [Candidatus Bathyarchaeota archaeon]